MNPVIATLAPLVYRVGLPRTYRHGAAASLRPPLTADRTLESLARQDDHRDALGGALIREQIACISYSKGISGSIAGPAPRTIRYPTSCYILFLLHPTSSRISFLFSYILFLTSDSL